MARPAGRVAGRGSVADRCTRHDRPIGRDADGCAQYGRRQSRRRGPSPKGTQARQRIRRRPTPEAAADEDIVPGGPCTHPRVRPRRRTAVRATGSHKTAGLANRRRCLMSRDTLHVTTAHLRDLSVQHRRRQPRSARPPKCDPGSTRDPHIARRHRVGHGGAVEAIQRARECRQCHGGGVRLDCGTTYAAAGRYEAVDRAIGRPTRFRSMRPR